MSSIQGASFEYKGDQFQDVQLPDHLFKLIEGVAANIERAIQESNSNLGQDTGPRGLLPHRRNMLGFQREKVFYQRIKEQVRAGLLENGAQTLPIDVCRVIAPKLDWTPQPDSLQHQFRRFLHKAGGVKPFWEKIDKWTSKHI